MYFLQEQVEAHWAQKCLRSLVTQNPEHVSPVLLLLEEFGLKGGKAVPGAAGGGERAQTNGRVQGMKAVGEVLKQEEERFLFSSIVSLTC